MTHKLPELGFAYDALEPFIDAMTMEIHYTKHHGGYVNNLNKALEAHSRPTPYVSNQLEARWENRRWDRPRCVLPSAVSVCTEWARTA